MALFPQVPTPASISAPAFIDPLWRFASDQSHEVRRAKHSRPRRRFILDYLGLTTHEMRVVRDFLSSVRYGLFPFSWIHWTALEPVVFANSTPIAVHFPTYHGLLTGQALYVPESPSGNAANGFYFITNVAPTAVLLNGSTSVGFGSGAIRVYLPNAVAILPEDTLPSPAKLIGPESGTSGRWNWTLTIEELF